jgi:hypothetical protein
MEFGARPNTDLLGRLRSGWARKCYQTDAGQGTCKTTLGHGAHPLVLECRFEESGGEIWNTSIEWLV